MELKDVDLTVSEAFSKGFSRRKVKKLPWKRHLDRIMIPHPYSPSDAKGPERSWHEVRMMDMGKIPLIISGNRAQRTKKMELYAAMSDSYCDRCGCKIESLPFPGLRTQGCLCGACRIALREECDKRRKTPFR